MDLISVLDIAASVASIVELSTGCIKSLLDLRASYQITDMNVQVSIAQLSTLRAALMQISAWEFESTDFIPSNLEMDFNLSLTSCKALIDGLNDQLVPLTIDQTPALNFRKKAQFLLNGREWSNLQTLLSHQISAIQLFLTTLQCRTQIEQETLLRKPESRRVLSSVRENSSSLLWLRDDESVGTRRSTYTETSEFLDSSFAFDAKIFRSKVYLTAMRSNLKQAVRVSARKFRHGSVGGRTARGRFDDGEMPVVRGKGKQSTIPPDILAEPHVFNAASSDRGFQEYTARTQLTASYESLPRPSMDWDSDAIEVLTSPLALPVNPSVGLDMDKHKQRIEGQPRYGNLQMPSFFKARGTSGSLSSRDSSSAALNLPGVEKKIAETQILLTGNAKTSALFLQRSMKLAFGHNYTKVTKEAFRISILRKMVQNMRDLLSSMRDLGFSLDSDSEPHAHTILTTMLTEIGESLPANVGTALAVLWKDPAVLDTFRQGGIQWDWDDPEYFFNSLQRISQYNYKPSLEDISRASNMNHDVQDVIITKKSGGKRHNYRFVDAVNSEVERSQWVYSSEVSLVVQIGNAAAYDIPYPGIEPTSTFKEDLIRLEQICSSRWLANTPVLVLLSNAGKTVRKLRGSNSQLSSDIGELQSYIRDSFLRVDRKYDMRVWVEYLETDDPTSVGRAAIGIIDKILIEQSVLMYGVD